MYPSVTINTYILPYGTVLRSHLRRHSNIFIQTCHRSENIFFIKP